MGERHREDDRGSVGTRRAEALPELDPWRQVGWIFSDDGCVAIARQGEELHPGVLAD